MKTIDSDGLEELQGIFPDLEDQLDELFRREDKSRAKGLAIRKEESPVPGERPAPLA